MNSEMDKPMYLEDEKQPRDEAFELYKQFLKLNKLEQDIFFVTTTLLHESGQSISSKIGFPVVKKDPHSIGSLCTYGRRYGLSAIVGLTQIDDDGNSAMPNPSETEEKSQKKTDVEKVAPNDEMPF